MANTITNTLTAVITATEDSTSNVPINRGTGNPNYDCQCAQYTEDFTLAGGANNLSLPISPVCMFYIKNKDAANTILLTWTENGGASQPILTMNPGDQLILWCDPTKTTPGLTAITLTPSVAGTKCEMFIGG